MVDVVKKSNTAASSNEGELTTSTRTSAPSRASATTFAGEDVDAGVAGGGDDLVAVSGQRFDELRSDQAAGPDDCDLHAYHYPLWTRWKSMPALGICAACAQMPAIGWDVCEPITGDVVAQVTLDPDTATLSSARRKHANRSTCAEQAVRRFAASALGITVAD